MRYDTAHALAQDIGHSDEYQAYAAAKAALEGNATTAALLNEYKKLQMALQVAAVTGAAMPQAEMQRFSQLSSLLYAGTETSAYLVAEMRLQQAMADIFKILTDAAGLQFDLPRGQ